jgi:hypothetical protein
LRLFDISRREWRLRVRALAFASAEWWNEKAIKR